METDSNSNHKTQIIIALIGAIALIIGAYFSYQAAKEPVLIVIRATQTAEARPTSIAQTLIAQSYNQTKAASVPSSTPQLITITLTNNDCNIHNFYLDDNLVFSPIEAGSTLTYSTLPGKHSSHTCAPNTTTCSEKAWFDWTMSTTQSIRRSFYCP